ncbi:Sec23/Sec24 family protein [Aspergillus saccharolyticus JOP 1030-1]|uniref:Sec23/Sec24 family protein n=1 Tax=Aspergillus saccharolyticus JOP 1030-1 TaxID=1450539 RepID=A0A318ZB02_9EURO|nr:Sec23/Sec24 family protein [Aspergillus saccharolyticus JOP 1030-1]PYH41893.1 Sec23/Sec24 family protein [Aspergillus saccharolyticus JOP 1030-1]
MADPSMYNTYGQGSVPGATSTDPNRTAHQVPPQGYPAVGVPPGPSPPQPGAMYGAPQQQQWSGYGAPPPTQPLQPPPGQFAHQTDPMAARGVSPDPSMAGLASQMSGLGIMGSDGGARTSKKKHRHAHHDIAGASASASQPLGAAPQAGMPATSQFLNTGLNQAPRPISPAASIPAPVNPALGGGAGAVPTQGKIDPEQIPSIPRSRDIPAQYYFNHVYPTMERHLPPPAAVPFVAHDQGNSSPKYARLTLNNIPSTSDFLSSTALPLGMILQPLARLDPGEQPIPVLDFGDAGPPRCRRCRTYINPFMSFRSGGNKFVCNMCTFPNDVTADYFAPIDPSGARVDRMQRPELMMGTVEFLVPKDYWNKEPVGLQWLFLIDVSVESVNRGFLKGVCKGIMEALYSKESSENPEDESTARSIPEGAKVGIITYDKEVHFYNLSAQLDQAQMMVMTDLEEPFVPLSEGLFVDPYESKNVITSLLQRIPTIFSRVKNPQPALLPALNAALSALRPTGGKIIGTIASLPTWGPGALSLRDDPKVHGTDGERKLFTTDHTGWRETAGHLAEAGVGVDMFIAAPSGTYMDVATIGHVPEVTGGETFFYPNFHAPRDIRKLSQELAHAVTRETGYQALMKVRCSNGLQVSGYHGNFVQHTFGADLEIGAIDADKAIGVSFSYDGKLNPKLDAHFQAALLYTSANGQRRVRCINTVAAVNEGGLETMKFVDQDAVVSMLAKEAASKTVDKPLKDIRASITEKSVDIFSGYRKIFSGSHPPGQLVLPENLKEFSMYMLSLLKSRALKGGQEASDRRIHDMRMLRSIGCTELSLYLYPRIIPIHNMQPTDGFPNEQGQLQVPPSLRASFSKIEEGGVYLVDNGQQCLLWLHSQVSPNLLEDLFGEGQNSLQGLSPQTSTIPVLETHLNAQVRNLLQYLSTIRGSKAVTIQLARQGLDGAEYEFARMLVEDRNNEAQSYVDWLVHIHRQINLELAGQRKRDDVVGEGGLTSLAGLRAPYW